MGLLLSRFRKKKNAEEELEDLTQKIQQIKEFQESEEEKLRLRVWQLLFYSSILYVFMILFCFLNRESFKNYHLITLFFFPLLIYGLRRMTIFYFKRKLTRNKLKIEVYKKDKQKILDDVKETETYKVAKRILEKYDVPQPSLKFSPPRVSTPIPIPKPTSGAITPYQTPMMNTDLRRRNARDGYSTQNKQLISAQKAPPTLVRPIVTENKGVFDRLLQKVVGDGPNERYALICKACGNHNGMALQEEFEFLSYRCAFCSYFNPARKQRAAMQNLLMQNLNLIAIKNASDSDSSDERKPLEITELEDSESESKEDSSSVENKNDLDKIVLVGKDEVEPSSPTEDMASNAETKEESSIANGKNPETASKDSHQDGNDENKDCQVLTEGKPESTALDDEEFVKVVNDGISELQSQIEKNTLEEEKEVSAMEVDEDEQPGIDLSTCVNKLSLES